MELATFIGFGAMVGLGLVLGLIGAGGSILTVPILVYLLGVAPTAATGYSLVIVGVTALVGAIQYLRRGQSNLRMAAVFGIPAIVGVYLTRRVIFPAIPDPVLDTGVLTLTKDAAVMILFAVFMLTMAISMLRTKRGAADVRESRPVQINYVLITILGVSVGIFTGLVGAGGGFMILPVLVLLGGLPIKIAIGTDLLIIAAKSLVGFIGEAQVSEAIDYGFIGTVIALPLIGIAIGTYLNHRVPAAHLKTAFGWFVLVMGVYIVTREIVLT